MNGKNIRNNLKEKIDGVFSSFLYIHGRNQKKKL